jgi:hypothetical protein
MFVEQAFRWGFFERLMIVGNNALKGKHYDVLTSLLLSVDSGNLTSFTG